MSSTVTSITKVLDAKIENGIKKSVPSTVTKTVLYVAGSDLVATVIPKISY